MSVKDFLLAKKALAEAEVLEYDNQAAALVVELKAERDAGYDEGQKDAGVPDDAKKYTEEDLQNELRPLKEQIAVLETKYAALVDGQAAAIAGAVFTAEAKFSQELADVSVDNNSLIEKYKKA